MVWRISLLLSLCFCWLHKSQAELWEKDMTDEVYIEASTEGFESVHLECLVDSMRVKLELSEEFEGIFYTRGSYKMGQLPCFNDVESGTMAELTIPYEGCETKSKDDIYTNVVIAQHDDFLIFPGDLAFEISCTKSSEDESIASIGLADPDPSAKELPKHKKSTVTATRSVAFTPNDVRPKKAPKAKTSKCKKVKGTSTNKDEL
ncbi:hypothetical protein TCAL_02803 [Tigriopus californicus]|uniref:ZP domain-containing protein n=1 Tax=Tigriopus californicus TaxID=6832 RepID=A0A553P0Q4_TIGCA|nr:uncharacterized protein LOC131887148 [Tigriopus californicus]TRY71192.1 hypothetical protein TCAL_02803 [Tigriopus californicus]|eukprot:TCALIF_02803-PA protein Name:"Protein of unknown function" AED:0.01 eAED:0.01 QI:0/-1/0/1/-1/1/1/0/203